MDPQTSITVSTTKITKISKMKSEEQNENTTSVESVEDGAKTKTKSTKKKVTTTKVSSATVGTTHLRSEHGLQEAANNTVTPTAIVSKNNHNDDTDDSPKEMNGKKKSKCKKSKKSEANKQNISVKSSFSKFDALQKRNLIHNPQGEKQTNCRFCDKPVYKMEEIKAEKSIFHKNCFRCHECNKPLKVDNYQSHEGVLYCTVHFKLLFVPKSVEDTEPEKPRKPELIIRENQPTELPPDVVRASDKPNLGLEELQQLNVRSRFQVFENREDAEQKESQQKPVRNGSGSMVVKRSATILSKMAKLQQLGSGTQVNDDDSTDASDKEDEASDSENNDNKADNEEFGCCKRRMQRRKRPVGLGEAIHDIRTKFEKGPGFTKEERREERKQEIQNIRSRLFMGKQARIKEMYQQAVAESEQAITSVGKKPDIEIDGTARTMKERFEKGEPFKESKSGHINDDAEVFESAISKKSRSIFMELDANLAACKNQFILPHPPHRSRPNTSNRFKSSEYEQENVASPETLDVIKYDEKPEDVRIETSELSEKFKFFETYQPTESKKRDFRITPPRDGVVKMPSPESDEKEKSQSKEFEHDTEMVESRHTASLMLNKFREMEQNANRRTDSGPKPLKCFTPPPDGGRRIYNDQESDYGSQDGDEEEVEDDGEEEDENEDYLADEYSYRPNTQNSDEALREAQAAARAKQLRAKFEKWQANEIQREMNEGRVDIYSQQVSDETIESTKSIRERFENMRTVEKDPSARPRHQVNRFV